MALWYYTGHDIEKHFSTHYETNVLPDITIDGYTVNFPCDKDVCNELIKHSTPSSYHVSTESAPVFDLTYRNSWEIDAKDVTIDNDDWLKEFSNSKSSQLLQRVRSAMAPESLSVGVSLVKLLVYKPGSFFKLHSDFRRRDHHFGTMIVFLPSFYTGGELIVHHKDKQRSYWFSLPEKIMEDDNALDKCHVVSFYRECKHEVKEIRSGYRAALAYSIYSEGGVPTVSEVGDYGEKIEPEPFFDDNLLED